MDVDMDMDMDMGSQDRFVARLLERYGVGGGPHGQPKVNFAELANDLEAKGVFRTVPSTTFLLDSNWAPAAPREKKQREKRQRTTYRRAGTAATHAHAHASRLSFSPAFPPQSHPNAHPRPKQLYTAKSVDINELQETDEANAQVTRIVRSCSRPSPRGPAPRVTCQSISSGSCSTRRPFRRCATQGSNLQIS